MTIKTMGCSVGKFRLRRTLYSYPISFALAIPTVNAAVFDINDDWSLETSTNITLGSSWALSNPDADLFSVKNGSIAHGKPGRGPSQTTDDGRLNFKRHDAFSQAVKGFTEFALRGQGEGAFIRFKYWYDHAYMNGHGHFYGSDAMPRTGPYAKSGFDDSGWDKLAKFKGFAILDAYVWKDFQLFDKPLSVKLGKHVLSWGEAIQIRGGINIINPLDGPAFNRPGAEIKEGLLPVEMLSFNYALAENLDLEAFYQLRWRPTVMDGCGTFFSSNDVLPEGCGPLYLSGTLSDEEMYHQGLYETPLKRERPSDSGQWGVALRKVLPSLNNSELAFYFVNYHSRVPYLSQISKDVSQPGTFPGGVQGPAYFAAYPENIQMYGLSINGTLPKLGTAWAGELSYRPNMPLGYNGTDSVNTIANGLSANTPYVFPEDFYTTGQRFDGWERKPVWQLSGSLIHPMRGYFGAMRTTLMAEAGAVYVQHMNGERFGRNSAFGRSRPTDGGLCYAPDSGVTNKFCNSSGFTTSFSWGYRLTGSLEYNDVLPGVNVTPSISFRHDVKGYSYQPGPFAEGQMAVGLGVNFNYQNRYNLGVSYNQFFGSDRYSVLDDRDYMSVNLKAYF